MVGSLRVLTTRLSLCLVVKEFEVVGSLVPLAIVLVLSWAWGDCLLWHWLEPFVSFFPGVDASGVLHSRLLKFLKSEVDVPLLVDVRAWSYLMGGYRQNVIKRNRLLLCSASSSRGEGMVSTFLIQGLMSL